MTEKLVSQLSEEEMRFFAKSFDTVITFCEGVLSRGEREISGSSNAIDVLKKCGKRIIYFSHDCSLSRREISENMRKMNYELKPNEIVCITSLMAKYLKNCLDEKKVYVIGSSGISEELNVVGLRNFGTGPDILTSDLATFVHSYEEDSEMGAVVVGFDEHFSYPKMLRAASYLSVTGVIHVASTVRTATAAALVACIETCSSKKALVFDTLSSIINDTLINDYRIISDKTLIVAPDNNDIICLAKFQHFQDLLSAIPDNTSSSLKYARKLYETSIDSSLYANDLAEVAYRLKI